MSDIPSKARVVIIGGGVVGISCLYHLAKRGWTDCVLLEKNELTSGSTWHAAGNVPTFSTLWSIMDMQRYSVELYKKLAEETDYPINYHVTGSLRLAHSTERMLEFQRIKAMGRHQGMALDILDADKMRLLYPFLKTEDLAGALYDPNDGDIDPAQLTQALAKGARELGAKIIRFCPVIAARRERNQWIIISEKGEITCDYVVNAAGYRAQEVGRLFGREVPMAVMSHQYLIFEEIKELAEWSKKTNSRLPLLRDVDSSYYLRQEQNGMNLGPYENTPKAHWHTTDDPMPEDFSFQLYPDDLERLEWYLNDAVERVPILATAGLSKIINGPIPYTPDGNPLIGPMPGVANAFEACVFSFGIAQAGGAGKVLAEWIIDGSPQWDMWSSDPRRYTNYTDPEYCLEKAIEIYSNEYAIQFPRRTWPAARERKLSPLHHWLKQQGAQFTPVNGWERATWYAQKSDNTSEAATLTFSRPNYAQFKGSWLQRVQEECLAVRDQVGILDLPGFSRFKISGKGSRDWLSWLSVSSIPKPGRIGLAYFADNKGRLVTEMSIMALDEDRFILITAAAGQWHDREWLEKHLPQNSAIVIEDITEQYHCQILTGPQSRNLLTAITDADLTKSWLSHQEAVIAGKPCRLVRVSFAGELGWEIHSLMEDNPAIFNAIWQRGQSFGLRLFGMWALDSLRLEKGYRSWKVDLSTDYTILQADLERFIQWDKIDFLGKQALLAEKAQGLKKSFATLTVDCKNYDAPYMASIWYDDKIVGEVTSGGYGFRVEKSIALGMLRADLNRPGIQVEIDIYGKKYPATVQPNVPLWDFHNRRIRA